LRIWEIGKVEGMKTAKFLLTQDNSTDDNNCMQTGNSTEKRMIPDGNGNISVIFSRTVPALSGDGKMIFLSESHGFQPKPWKSLS
jgi:hypothetical protein